MRIPKRKPNGRIRKKQRSKQATIIREAIREFNKGIMTPEEALKALGIPLEILNAPVKHQPPFLLWSGYLTTSIDPAIKH